MTTRDAAEFLGTSSQHGHRRGRQERRPGAAARQPGRRRRRLHQIDAVIRGRPPLLDGRPRRAQGPRPHPPPRDLTKKGGRQRSLRRWPRSAPRALRPCSRHGGVSTARARQLAMTREERGRDQHRCQPMRWTWCCRPAQLVIARRATREQTTAGDRGGGQAGRRWRAATRAPGRRGPEVSAHLGARSGRASRDVIGASAAASCLPARRWRSPSRRSARHRDRGLPVAAAAAWISRSGRRERSGRSAASASAVTTSPGACSSASGGTGTARRRAAPGTRRTRRRHATRRRAAGRRRYPAPDRATRPRLDPPGTAARAAGKVPRPSRCRAK